MRPKELELGLRIIIIFLSISTTLGWDKANLQTLELVQVIMRHGDRNPIWTFPLDPHKDDPTYWLGGLEQLTELGVKQTHELGRFFRERYDGFISKTYIQDEVSAWSSYKDRAIRSGLSFLRGLYPKVNKNTGLTETVKNSSSYDDGEVSQVVPLRTIPKELDDHIINGVKCPRWKKLQSEALTSPEGRRWEDLSTETAKMLKNYTGLTGTWDDVATAFDYLFCQKLQNKTPLDWATPELIEFGEKYINYRLSLDTLTYEMKRLRSGIVRKVVQNMEKRAENRKDSEAGNLKFVLYSGHDKTLITFLNILDLYNNLKTSYASAVLVELHKDPNFSDQIVEIYFRNDTTVEPHKLELKECRNPCFLPQLLQITESFFPDDYGKACQLSRGSMIYIHFKLIVILVFLFCTVYHW